MPGQGMGHKKRVWAGINKFHIRRDTLEMYRPIPKLENKQTGKEGHFSMKVPDGKSKDCKMHPYRKRMTQYCPSCEIGLCSVQCFLKWHKNRNLI